MIIPENIKIEIVNGVCTAKCIMCPVDQWTRKPQIMTHDEFKTILSKLLPYKNEIKFITLHGCGEPLVDKKLDEKIFIAKEMGFTGVGFSTNCTDLDVETSEKLVKAGLDSIICSIDGINKETHESIRVGTNFEDIVNNVKKFIEVRNKMGKTKLIIRLIRQEKNYKEWEAFSEYWNSIINKDLGDEVQKFDVHNWGEDIENYDDLDINRNTIVEGLICPYIFERLFIYANGDVGLCCVDDNGYYEMGNVLIEDPIEIFNNEIFTKYRDFMKEGKLLQLEYCKNCAVPRSRYKKECAE